MSCGVLRAVGEACAAPGETRALKLESFSLRRPEGSPRGRARGALRSEEGGGSRMRVRAERCASLPRSARTLTPTPLPAGEGLHGAALTNAAATVANLP